MRNRSPKIHDDEDDDVFDHVQSADVADPPLPWKSLIVLTLLYVVQGLPTGLVMASLPFLLRARLSYSQLGIVSFASWPYALKLLWSPIVDTKYVASFGRRKSWIVPMQLVIAGVMLALGESIAPDLSTIGPDNASVYVFTLALFTIVLCAATQDIAVDGLAIANGVLPVAHRGLASTTQSIGLNCGYFMSFTVFLAFNSADFCNAWLRSPENASSVGVLTLNMYCTFIAYCFFATTLYMAVFFREPAVSESAADVSNMHAVYADILNIAKLKPVQELSLAMMTCKVGFVLFDAVTTLRLLDKGVRQQDVAVFALVDFPLQLLVALYASKHAISSTPLALYRVGFFFRALVGVCGVLLVYLYPGGAPSTLWWLLLLLSSLAYSSASSLMFVSQCALFSRVADESIAGTYVTFLNSVTNLGSSWPKFCVLILVDVFAGWIGDGYFVLALFSTLFNAGFFLRMMDRLLALQHVPASRWMLRDSSTSSTTSGVAV